MASTTKRKGEDAIPEEPRKRPLMKSSDGGDDGADTSSVSAEASEDQVAKIKHEINDLKQRVKSLKMGTNGSCSGSVTSSESKLSESRNESDNTETSQTAKSNATTDAEGTEEVIETLTKEIQKLEKKLLDLVSNDNASILSATVDKGTNTKSATLKAALATKFGAPSFGTPSFGSKNFGASSFGSPAFGALSFDLMKAEVALVDDKPETSNEPTSSESSKSTSNPVAAAKTAATKTTNAGSLFGANSRFGNAFQELLKKKSFLDDLESLANESSNDELRQPKPQFKQVDLAPVEVKTGEENENQLLKINSKLYELDITHIDSGWKERGEGALHINEAKDKLSKRMVMRLVGVHKVILNYRITPQTEFIKGYSASIVPGKFVRFNLVNSDGKPVQYMLKFKDEKTRDMVVDLMLSKSS